MIKYSNIVSILLVLLFCPKLTFAQPKPAKTIITPEQLKILDKKRKEAIGVAQKTIVDSQPENVYAEFIKNEKMTPNLEPVKSRVYGNKQARNKLVLFSDFACGHCSVASKELKKRVDENKGLVNLTYVFYPLDKGCNSSVSGKLSDYSCFAAKLALCAEKYGKVWQGIDYLYGHQEEGRSANLNKEQFIKQISSNLKIQKLNECFSSKWVEDKLRTEQLVHKGLKIPGTPIIVLNNKRLGNTYKSDKVFANFIKYVDLKEHPKGK